MPKLELMHKLKKFDLFGASTQFFILGEEKHRSFFGFLISTACFVLTIIAIFFFGSNFYKRENPNIVTENILTNDYSTIEINKNNFEFAFRIEDYLSQYLNHTELGLFINIYYFLIHNFTTNNYTQILVDSTYCNSSLINNDKMSGEKSNNTTYLCFPMLNNDIEDKNGKRKGMKLGGSYSGEYMYYLSFEISNCNSDKSICNDMNDIDKILTQAEPYITFYYPEAYFQSNNLTDPLKSKLSVAYQRITSKTLKSDTIFIKYFFLNDDQGWLFRTPFENQKLTTDKVISKFDAMDYTDNPKAYHKMYLLEIYYINNYIKYYRTYMKLQDLSATVGGFMKLIFFVCQILVIPYNTINKEVNLINLKYHKQDEDYANTSRLLNDTSLKKINNLAYVNDGSTTNNHLKNTLMNLNNQKKTITLNVSNAPEAINKNPISAKNTKINLNQINSVNNPVKENSNLNQNQTVNLLNKGVLGHSVSIANNAIKHSINDKTSSLVGK